MPLGYSIPPSLLPYLTGSKKDYSTVQGSIIKVNAVFLPLVILSTGSRLFVRFRMLRAAGLDDGRYVRLPFFEAFTESGYICSPDYLRIAVCHSTLNIMPARRTFWSRKTHLESRFRSHGITVRCSTDNKGFIRLLSILLECDHIHKALHYCHIY